MIMKEVYEKYKHLDKCLSDKMLMPEGLPGQVLYDLWETVKENVMLKFIALDPEKIAEIRNSLAIISGNAQIMFRKKRVVINSSETEKLNVIIKQANRIDKLLPQLWV